jgi:hypothetical protein
VEIVHPRVHHADRLGRQFDLVEAPAVVEHRLDSLRADRLQHGGGVVGVKAAVSIPVIVNGDIVTSEEAREALDRSGADALMLGRGVYGRPWLAAHLERALADGTTLAEPGPEDRLAIVIEHLSASLAFYGSGLGLRMFRKHLGWYVEQAPWPPEPQARRAARSALCRLDDPVDVAAGLAQLWGVPSDPLGHLRNSVVDKAPQAAEAMW